MRRHFFFLPGERESPHLPLGIRPRTLSLNIALGAILPKDGTHIFFSRLVVNAYIRRVRSEINMRNRVDLPCFKATPWFLLEVSPARVSRESCVLNVPN